MGFGLTDKAIASSVKRALAPLAALALMALVMISLIDVAAAEQQQQVPGKKNVPTNTVRVADDRAETIPAPAAEEEGEPYDEDEVLRRRAEALARHAETLSHSA